MEIVRERVAVSVVGDFSPRWRQKPEEAPESNVEQFQAACKAIGQALAESDHPIVLCVPRWGSWRGEPDQPPLVCDYVVDGASKAQLARDQDKPQITVYHTKERVPPDIHGTIPDAIRDEKKPDKVNLVWKPLLGPQKYESESFPSVRQASAIILVSGGELSEYVACAAHYVRDLPVVAITSFGGAAAALYDDVFLNRYEGFASGDAQVRELLGVLDDTWDEERDDTREGGVQAQNGVSNNDRARRVVKLTLRLYRANEMQKKKENKNWWRLVVGCVVLLLVWILVFTGLRIPSGGSNGTTLPAKGATPTTTATASPTATETPGRTGTATLSPTATTAPSSTPTPVHAPGPTAGPLRQALGHENFRANFLLWIALLLAATLGMLLRIVIAFRSGRVTRVDRAVVWIDVAAAIVLAMGFALVYLLGGWLFTNNPALPKPGEGVPSLVVALSIIGVAAGLLLPVEALRKRLQQFASPEKPGKET